MEISISRSGVPSPLISNRNFVNSGLPNSSFKNCYQSHRSYAEILKSKSQSSYQAQSSVNLLGKNSSQSQSTVNLLEKIAALEAELSFLRAHLRLEESFSTSILRYLPDTVGKETACPKCTRKKSNDRSIINNRADDVTFDQDFESSISGRDIPIRADEETLFIRAETNLGSSCYAIELSYEELSGAPNGLTLPMHSPAKEQLALKPALECIAFQDPKDIHNAANVMDPDIINWYNSFKVLMHEASGLAYLLDFKTFIKQVSNKEGDTRVLFYEPKNDSFFIIQSGELGRENKKVPRDNDWDRSSKYSRNSSGFNPQLLQLFRQKMMEENIAFHF